MAILWLLTPFLAFPLVGALVQPLRAGLQRVIDQRFYRRKYDAARTLQAFGATLRGEVELSDLRAHLEDTVDQAMRPASVSLWLRPAHAGASRDSAPKTVAG